jgi:hypothetical protein
VYDAPTCMLTDLTRSFRVLGIVAVLICLAARSAPAAPTNDLSKQELTGPVETAVTRHPQLRTIYHYDRDGRLTKVELFPTQKPIRCSITCPTMMAVG